MSDSRSPADIEAEIERQRKQLGETVDRLGEKLDVKKQAGDRIAAARDRATTDSGAPRPEVIAGAAVVVLAVVALIWRRRTR